MFLAIDIGNTTASFGIFDNHKLLRTFSFYLAGKTDKNGIIYEINSLFDANIDEKSKWQAGLSSVVPYLTDEFVSLIKARLGEQPTVLTSDAALNFKLRYAPGQMGSDRLANIIAARKLCGYPSIVVDMGTATKYDIIDNLGDYIGGLIAPGVAGSANSLFRDAAQLFPVNIERPRSLIAENTSDALQSGIFHGFLAQVDGILKMLRAELGYPVVRIVATGGYAQIFAGQSSLIETVDPDLTLKGIEIFASQKILAR